MQLIANHAFINLIVCNIKRGILTIKTANISPKKAR